MKILYITLENLSLQKGSVVHIKEIVAGLRRHGHEVGLIARSSGDFHEVDFFQDIQYTVPFLSRFVDPVKQSYFFSSLLLFVSLFRTLHRYDVVYGRDFHTVVIALLPRLLYRKKLVFEINGLASEEVKLKGDTLLYRAFSKITECAERIATARSDLIVSVTPQLASHLVVHFRGSPRKMRIVGNGVNVERFHPFQDATLLTDWRKRLGIGDQEKVIVFVGNLAPWQGVDILTESVLLLLSKGEGLKLLVVGDGLLKARLLAKVSDSGFGRHFIFTGMMGYDEIPALIHIADICVAPFISRRNRKTGVSPLKVFEYMACGKPVVASKIEGLEFIETEKIGRLVDPENPISLQNALLELLHEPERCKAMGQRGSQIAREKFSWESRSVEIDRVLTELA
jgi:glycosyltransferase involved in cell wall biosynthesis